MLIKADLRSPHPKNHPIVVSPHGANHSPHEVSSKTILSLYPDLDLNLATNSKALNYGLVTLLVDRFYIVEKPTALRYHFQEATPGVIVFFMCFKVVGQI